MKSWMIVGCGGFLGAGLRHLVAVAVQRWPHQLGGWPMPLTVNILGCFLVGALTGLAESHDWVTPSLRLFLVVGLLGGFTTFSAFGLDLFTLVRGAEFARAVATTAAHLVLGLAAVALGYWMGR